MSREFGTYKARLSDFRGFEKTVELEMPRREYISIGVFDTFPRTLASDEKPESTRTDECHFRLYQINDNIAEYREITL